MKNKKGITHDSSPSAESRRVGQDYLFGIGINGYKKWDPLHNAVRDVEIIVELLQKDYQFNPENTKLLLNEEATLDNIIIAFEDYVDRITPDDTLLIYFSGHGHLNPTTNRGYWVPVDADRRSTAQFLPNSRVREFLEDIDAHHILLISDACFAGSLFYRGGGMGEEVMDALDRRRSRWGFCSGRNNEMVMDGPSGGHSPFASSIIEVLTENREQFFNVQRLIEQVTFLTRAQYNQLPEGQPLVQCGHKGGEFIFRRRVGEKDAWRKASVENTIPSLKGFLNAYPKGIYESEANKQLGRLQEEHLWENIQKERNLQICNDYLLGYPNGKYSSQVIQILNEIEEDAEWEKAKGSMRLYLLHRYINNYPEGKYIEMARHLAQNYGSVFDQAEEFGRGTLESPALSLEKHSETQVQIPEMILVEKGGFLMGSNTFRREQPIHRVLLSSFSIGKFPVTFREYDMFCEMTRRQKPSDEGWGRGNRPVINVNWYDAIEYCNWLSEMFGLEPAYYLEQQEGEVQFYPNASGYRLPTEAEWEYAARGGQWDMGYEFPGGNELDELGWYVENSGGKTREVGGKAPNELGVHDLCGNCYEWCFDFWEHSYYEEFARRTAVNPSGPITGVKKVIRGGSYQSQKSYCRVSYRDDHAMEKKRPFIGFRLVQSSRNLG
jgi:formylglycine-generating enzyme required for sulfatase activity